MSGGEHPCLDGITPLRPAFRTLHHEGKIVLDKLSDSGLTSEHMYMAGFASIALSFASWGLSRAKPDDSKAQADRWGIFVGHWAPSFFALGNALALRELRH